jgi:hypothetical protein
MTRNEKILVAIDPSFQLGIEVGPLAKPVVTKDMGDIAYIDHANTDELRKWYLCIKEILNLDRVEFKLGDFMPFLEKDKSKYDGFC